MGLRREKFGESIRQPEKGTEQPRQVLKRGAAIIVSTGEEAHPISQKKPKGKKDQITES